MDFSLPGEPLDVLFLWKMNVCTRESQLQSTPASAACNECKECLLPAETENLGSWAEQHCVVFLPSPSNAWLCQVMPAAGAG